jgi:hypothetical protein
MVRIKDHRRRNDRPSKRPAPDFINPRNQLKPPRMKPRLMCEIRNALFGGYRSFGHLGPAG